MGHQPILTRTEIESLGPPMPKDLEETGLSEVFLSELALKHVASQANPTSASVGENLCLPWSLTETLLHELYREKLIEIRSQGLPGATRYAMLDRGWERLEQVQRQCGYVGPAPVALADYAHMMRLQAVPSQSASLESVRSAFSDLVLPESLLQTLGCVINSRSSLFLTGVPGTGKTAVSERMNRALFGFIWIPYAIEVDGQIIRIFDSHCHRQIPDKTSALKHDRRWVEIERPLIIVGGELNLGNTDLVWSETLKFNEAPFQVKSNGGTLVIDDFGRQRVAPRDLLNRWIMPLERRVDFLTLHNGKKIEVPFEQLVIFSTNVEEEALVDEAFLRRMGYRARLEVPSAEAYAEIFRRAAAQRGIILGQGSLDYVLRKYSIEERQMKSCEPRDLLNRVTDICLFEGNRPSLTPELIDLAWRNYFGAAHGFGKSMAHAAGQPGFEPVPV
jgi:predicted ATPase with chaperone activity